MRACGLWFWTLCLLPGVAPAAEKALEYRGQYICQSGEPDHLMCAQGLSDGRAIVAGNRGLALIHLPTLPVSGTREYIFRLTGVNARDLCVTGDERHVFVNTHRESNGDHFGLAVVRIEESTLQKVATRNEPGVLYEKMCLAGDRLYVAAHSKGIRVFDVSNPEAPVLVGRLGEGFVDAFSMAVDGDVAYVADGAGGLKIVDVTDPASPSIIDGETLETAEGTSEDIVLRDGRVYVAAGGGGLAVYESGPTHDLTLGSRNLHRTGGCAESLCWVGDHLAVGTIEGVVVFEIGAGTQVTGVAMDKAHRRGASARLRLLNGVGPAPDNRLLCANWNFLDVYELVDAGTSTQPDLQCSEQRLRFSPEGGTKTVTVSNNGRGSLLISSVSSSHPDFQTAYSGGELLPGEEVSLEVSYSGSATSDGQGVIALVSNDPDESPLPIQVFGNTTYLDPGEDAVDFTLPALARDPVTDELVQTEFSLAAHRGRIVWYSIFATW